jgi:hypothetical protein
MMGGEREIIVILRVLGIGHGLRREDFDRMIDDIIYLLCIYCDACHTRPPPTHQMV